MNIPTLCIYHANCADGFAAAWVVKKYMGGQPIIFHPGFYDQPPPSAYRHNVLLVGFSYKKEGMTLLLNQAADVFVLDHHKTAEAELEDLFASGLVSGRFDMEKSGAMLAWEHFFPGQPAPRLLSYVQDRDLWRFHLPFSRELNDVVFSYPYSFSAWDELAARFDGDLDTLMAEGSAIRRKHLKDIEELLAVTKVYMVIGEHLVPVANLPYTMASDAGNIMAKSDHDYAFAATYFDKPGSRVFSLRSVEGGLDVSEVARRYGGGGHEHDAGFTAQSGWSGEELRP